MNHVHAHVMTLPVEFEVRSRNRRGRVPGPDLALVQQPTIYTDKTRQQRPL
jgi:hypothetical protein